MTVRAARVLAFPGIDLEALAKLRARACDAFMREDLVAYQDACMMIRKLIGGRDVSETGARLYRYSENDRPRRSRSQQARDRLSAKLKDDCQAPSRGEWAAGGNPDDDRSRPA
jgi:hypothetical protein